MTLRLALLSLLLAPLIACSPSTPTAPAADAPAATPAPAPAAAEPAAAAEPTTPASADAPTDAPAAAPATAEASSPPAADAPAAPAAAAAPPAGPAPVAGTDYQEITNGQPYEPLNGKVEVVEVFGYVCPACARFQPDVSAWKTTLPADVRFTYVPALFGGIWDNYARAFFAAESMGIESKVHDAVYKAIHVDQVLKGERGQDSVEDIAAFFGKAGGVDAKQFASTMASFAVSAKTNKAKAFALRSQISGTPSLIINGKYLVKGKSYEDMLRIANHLIAQERGGAGAR